MVGLPPMLVMVAAGELLFEDAQRLATTARRDGVDVTLYVGPGSVHAWPLFAHLPEAASSTDRIGDFLRDRLDRHACL